MKDDNTKDDKEIKENQAEAEPEVDTDPGDDLVFEENTEVTGGDHQAKIQKLKERIKELEKKNAELLDGWQRERAEIINIKKREAEEKKEFAKFAKEALVADFVPVLDAFESAMKNKEAWEKVEKNWRVGVEYIHSQLLGILTSNGLETLNPLGEMFNPERDEAIENIGVEREEEDGKILEVVQAGYALHNKIIRPVKVKVGHFKS